MLFIAANPLVPRGAYPSSHDKLWLAGTTITLLIAPVFGFTYRARRGTVANGTASAGAQPREMLRRKYAPAPCAGFT
jgi:hypothetical protein